MIIDTTYLLPLAKIGVRTDLLRAIIEGSANGVDLRDLTVSLISLFELQAKAAKLGIPPDDVTKAIGVILRSFRVIPFYHNDIVREAHRLRKILIDYIDCIIVATAIVLGEDLVTEDTIIHRFRKTIERDYGIRVLSYKDLVSHG